MEERGAGPRDAAVAEDLSSKHEEPGPIPRTLKMKNDPLSGSFSHQHGSRSAPPIAAVVEVLLLSSHAVAPLRVSESLIELHWDHT